MKYKVGQKVRRINDPYGDMPVGTIVTISSIDKTGTLFDVKEKIYHYGNEYWCFNRFKLVKEEPVENIIEYKGKKYDVEEIINDYDYDGRKIYSLELKEHKEIIEEDKKIEKFVFGEIEDEEHFNMKLKINKLIDEVNKLKEEK